MPQRAKTVEDDEFARKVLAGHKELSRVPAFTSAEIAALRELALRGDALKQLGDRGDALKEMADDFIFWKDAKRRSAGTRALVTAWAACISAIVTVGSLAVAAWKFLGK